MNEDRVGVTRERMTRIEDGMIVVARNAVGWSDRERVEHIRELLVCELFVTDPLPLLVITPEARGALTRLIGSLLTSPASFEARPRETARAFSERLLSEHLDVVDA